MTRFGWLVASGTVVAVVGIALLVWGFARQSHIGDETLERAVTEAIDPSSLSIYTNGVYGFSLYYPASASASDSFGEGSSWRANANATGTPIVLISLPEGEVRIGASADREAASECLVRAPSESELGPVTVGSTTWTAYRSERLGTEDARRVTSYRTLHEGSCFALEALEPLSGRAASGIELIVQSFTFAR